MSIPSARSPAPSAATAALRALLAAFSEAWQERRYSDLTTWLAPDMVFLLPGGTARITGRDAVIESYREFMDRISLTSYREAPAIVDVWGATAVTTTRWEMSWLAGGVPNHATGCESFVLHTSEDTSLGWQIVWRTLGFDPAPEDPNGTAA